MGGGHTVRKSGTEVRTADQQIKDRVYDEGGTLPTGLKSLSTRPLHILLLSSSHWREVRLGCIVIGNMRSRTPVWGRSVHSCEIKVRRDIQYKLVSGLSPD